MSIHFSNIFPELSSRDTNPQKPRIFQPLLNALYISLAYYLGFVFFVLHQVPGKQNIRCLCKSISIKIDNKKFHNVSKLYF